MFNPIIRKVIVSRDVVDKEDESWDGNIDRSVIGAGRILYDEKDKRDHEDQEDQPSDQE